MFCTKLGDDVMRSEDIRLANSKFYYCDNYIWSLKRLYTFMPILFVFITQVILWTINRMLLKRKYIAEAASQNLEMIDVGLWVKDKLRGSLLDRGSVTILICGVFIGVLLILRICGVFKSYELYKNKWIRFILVFAYVVEVAAILIIYNLKNCNAILVITIILDIVPILLSSRLLYPLESRPDAGDTTIKSILKFWDWLAKIIIKKL